MSFQTSPAACHLCSNGTYSGAMGAASPAACVACPAGTTPVAGSTYCSWAAAIAAVSGSSSSHGRRLAGAAAPAACSATQLRLPGGLGACDAAANYAISVSAGVLSLQSAPVANIVEEPEEPEALSLRVALPIALVCLLPALVFAATAVAIKCCLRPASARALRRRVYPVLRMFDQVRRRARGEGAAATRRGRGRAAEKVGGSAAAPQRALAARPHVVFVAGRRLEDHRGR